MLFKTVQHVSNCTSMHAVYAVQIADRGKVGIETRGKSKLSSTNLAVYKLGAVYSIFMLAYTQRNV